LVKASVTLLVVPALHPEVKIMTKPLDFAAFVGVDWADQQHAVCLASPDGARLDRGVLDQEATAINDWARELQQRFAGQRIAVCLEQSRGALIYALLKYEFLVLFPLNPKQLARYRQAFAPSGAKDDPTDAELLCRFVREHHQQLRAWCPDDVATRALRLLSEDRRQAVDERTGYGNRLQQCLKETFPLALELAGKNIYAERFLNLLAKYPTLRELQRASPRQLVKLLSRRRRVADEPSLADAQDPRVLSVRAAVPLTTDPAVLEAARLKITRIVALLHNLNEAIEAYDRQIAERFATHDDAPLFANLPGAGPALAPRLAAAFGSDRTRYQSAEQLQSYSGIAPITVRSGKSCVVKRRRACPRFLRQTFHEFARCSRIKSAWAAAYCRMLIAQGHGFHAALRALAFKWIRILFRCWQQRTPYNEHHYLEQLRRKNSPLLAFLPQTP
jgi:transposase